MSVYYCIPSIRPGGGTLTTWREAGYKLAVLRQGDPIGTDIEIPTGQYLGWARSINILSRAVFLREPDTQWIVSGGDDYLPDPDHIPEGIAVELSNHFDGTFGVMQPTGDRWGDDAASRARWGEDRGAMIDRIAGSPWLGREWCERTYGGRGPMPEEYMHCYADEELCEVAEKLGVYWRRRDLLQHHAHWLRENNSLSNRADMPESWPVAERTYREGRALFEERKRLGYPGHEPLEAR